LGCVSGKFTGLIKTGLGQSLPKVWIGQQAGHCLGQRRLSSVGSTVKAASPTTSGRLVVLLLLAYRCHSFQEEAKALVKEG
jgi:hypothetical protein